MQLWAAGELVGGGGQCGGAAGVSAGAGNAGAEVMLAAVLSASGVVSRSAPVPAVVRGRALDLVRHNTRVSQ